MTMKGWPMSYFFSLECCEHKKGPVGPQIEPLAFKRHCTPFYTKPTHHLYYFHVHYHYPHEKAVQNKVNFGCLKVFLPTQ